MNNREYQRGGVMDLIKRADAIKVLTEVLFDEPPYLNSIEKCETFARKTLADIPSFEPTIEIEADQLAKLLREGWTIHSEPKQGEWIAKTENYHSHWECSECGGWALLEYNEQMCLSKYCPDCGARMKGADNE